MEAYAIYPGSCGEIIQGCVQGKDMLLSCPVNLFTTVRVYECQKPINRFNYIKSSTILDNMLKRWGYEYLHSQFDIDIESAIPKSKGFASSTADLCGVYICLLKLFNRQYDIKEAVEEFVKIEPTDSIIFRDMVLFDYKEGKYDENIGDYIKFYILAFEGTRAIDTLAFNERNLPPLSDINDILQLVKEGVKSADISKIAQASETSIRRNLKRLSYDIYGDVENLSRMTGGLGLIGGHSGNVLGIIYNDREKCAYAAKNKYAIAGCKTYFLVTLQGNEHESYYDYRTGKQEQDKYGKL